MSKRRLQIKGQAKPEPVKSAEEPFEPSKIYAKLERSYQEKPTPEPTRSDGFVRITNMEMRAQNDYHGYDTIGGGHQSILTRVDYEMNFSMVVSRDIFMRLQELHINGQLEELLVRTFNGTGSSS